MKLQTKKGTELPLLNLKGKQYLMVAYRIQWMNEDIPQFDISTEFLLINDEQTVVKATVALMDDTGKVVKKAQATKRETKKDFPDHTEKAETAAIGRALSLLGFGTQFALSDLDEGQRLADSPVVKVEKVVKDETKELKKVLDTSEEELKPGPLKDGLPKKPAFKPKKMEAPKAPEVKKEVAASEEDEWRS